MDLSNAIAAHTQWKVKLRGAIVNKEKLDAATISKDNCCELGKWLYGEAKAKLGSYPSYAQTIAAHAAFHKVAGKVAANINSGAFDAASKLMDSSEYIDASSAVGTAIVQLRKASGL